MTTSDVTMAAASMDGPPVKVHFCVQLDRPVRIGQAIFVCGNVPELGAWNPEGGIILTATDNSDNPKWKGFVETTSQLVQFRYFIGYYLDEDGLRGRRFLVVDSWEAFVNPRHCMTTAEVRGVDCRLDTVDRYGYYAGQRVVNDGWLNHDVLNQIIFRVHGSAIKYHRKKGELHSPCLLRLTPFDVRRRPTSLHLGSSMCEDDEDEDSCEEAVASGLPSFSDAEVAILSSDDPHFRLQHSLGEPFSNRDDYLVFRTMSVAVEYLALFLDLFSADGLKRIGRCTGLPALFPNTHGTTLLSLQNRHGVPIGSVTVEYLFVRNLRLPHPIQTMSISYARHWNRKRTTVEVGHRGAGNSYTKFAMSRENTIHSLDLAATNGADFVEFDVQLSKDLTPVIYHDFHVLVSVARRAASVCDLSSRCCDNSAELSSEFHEVPVKDLKLHQLRLLILDHQRAPEKIENVQPLRHSDDEEEDRRPFPTLAEALQRVNPDVGFNIEIKFPMLQQDGVHECENYFERNLFVDRILADLLTYAGRRRILLSSFDPDICSMVALKQNVFPVLFLCVGDTTRYAPFHDARASSSGTAVRFAACSNILGVNFNSEDLLKDTVAFRLANDYGLVSFVWGDDFDNPETHRFFKQLGVHGIIYDRIGESEERRNVFMVEREQKRALFQSSGTSTPINIATSPGPVGATEVSRRLLEATREEEMITDEDDSSTSQNMVSSLGVSNNRPPAPTIGLPSG